MKIASYETSRALGIITKLTESLAVSKELMRCVEHDNIIRFSELYKKLFNAGLLVK